jgi:hypothetical protein
MIRILSFGLLAGVLLVNAGCTTCCLHKPTCPPPKAFVAPAPPAPVIGQPVPVVQPAAGATFGPPSGFPTAPAGVGNVPPLMTPMPPPKDAGNLKIGSNWQPVEKADTNPRVQLYAPEAVTKDKPKPAVQGTFPPIPMFAEAKPNVYAGLRPSADGLDWLHKDKISTIVQIRSPGADDAGVKKEAEARQMRFIAFEVSKNMLTKEKADEFIRLIRDNAKSGVFVYDKDGSLAGAMWYLYLRWGEILDDDAAQLRARPLGLENTRDGAHREMWLAVQKLLSENNP